MIESACPVGDSELADGFESADRKAPSTCTLPVLVLLSRCRPMVLVSCRMPGRGLTDVAVMIAGGGECISDIAALADQPGVFGPVAADSTCWQVLDAISG